MDVLAADEHRLTLLVVPSNTDRAAAHRTMALTADRHNVQTVDDLLAAGVSVTASTQGTTDQTRIALAVWEADGGRIPEQKRRRIS
ncbi:hypothetical protein SK571_14300 [Lentzea sp. BCCO 10_0798]|uniref:Uncharacterized protein n=1 Tax=Lentzea kristufekii TaxID=3095430 RepID=A0ABU4TQK6_9PSEU|nr:hypothetical protein [Lentzea sp. BCCO 10_0798]MDX8050558.1 hypothetical protein [Lentzea sp. BCCO 10_0798]